VAGVLGGSLGLFHSYFLLPFKESIPSSHSVGGHFVRTLKRLANEICRSSVVRAKEKKKLHCNGLILFTWLQQQWKQRK